MARSCIWKKIRSFSSFLQKDSRWKVGNGSFISLWFDNWLDNGPIASRFPLLQFSQSDLVKDIIQGNSWLIPSHLPDGLRAFLLQAANQFLLGGPSVKDTLSWQGHPTSSLSLKAAWNILRTSADKVVRVGLILAKFCFSKSCLFQLAPPPQENPTDYWAKNRGRSLACKCFSCSSSEEDESHLFFSCNLAYQFWTWLLSILGSVSPPAFTPSFIWQAFANGGDANGRKCIAAIFLHVISVLWFLRNGSKHQGRKLSLHRAKLLLMDRLKGMAISQPAQSHPLPVHQILVHFALVS